MYRSASHLTDVGEKRRVMGTRILVWGLVAAVLSAVAATYTAHRAHEVSLSLVCDCNTSHVSFGIVAVVYWSICSCGHHYSVQGLEEYPPWMQEPVFMASMGTLVAAILVFLLS